jgi:ribosomal protein S18 acetylase RimI-like enzyme
MRINSNMRKTTAELVVRPRRPSDDAFIFQLSDRIFAPYSRRPTGSMASMLAERDAVACVAEHGKASQALREASLAPVGFFVLGFEHLGKSFGPWSRPAVARLNAIGVEPDLHRRGIGTLLLEYAEAVARQHGAVSLTLMTADTNLRARRLFAGAGFQALFTLEHAYARGQRGVVMTKPL